MRDEGLGSKPPPAPDRSDHVRGEGPLLIEYADFECPYCAQTHARLTEVGLTRVFRHFPVVSKHPRSRVLAQAAEAAALQGRFWDFHDSLYEDQGRLDDPHLWARCQALGLDVDRFEADRRSAAVAQRVERDFRSGIRAGVATTPTLFFEGKAHPGVASDEVLRAWASES